MMGEVKVPAQEWGKRWAKATYKDFWESATVRCDIVQIKDGKFVVKYEDEPDMLISSRRLLRWDHRFRVCVMGSRLSHTDGFLPWSYETSATIRLLLKNTSTRDFSLTPEVVLFVTQERVKNTCQADP